MTTPAMEERILGLMPDDAKAVPLLARQLGRASGILDIPSEDVTGLDMRIEYSQDQLADLQLDLRELTG